MKNVCTEIHYTKFGFRPNFQIQITVSLISRFFFAFGAGLDEPCVGAGLLQPLARLIHGLASG